MRKGINPGIGQEAAIERFAAFSLLIFRRIRITPRCVRLRPKSSGFGVLLVLVDSRFLGASFFGEFRESLFEGCDLFFA